MELALKDNPNNIDFLNNLGMFYSNIYQYKKAEDCYKKGLKIDSNNLSLLNNLANLINYYSFFRLHHLFNINLQLL